MCIFVAALVMLPCRHLIVVLLGLLCACQPYSRSLSGVSALDKKTLYDFRNTASPAPKLDVATERRVLAAVSSRHYDNLLECGGDKEGVVLRITSVAAGSFTAAGAKQTAYLVGVTRCGETMAEMGSDLNRLMVFSGNQVVASAGTRFDLIAKTYDLNGDGIDELLLEAGSAHGGEATTNATLLRFDKQALATVENFGIVYHDVCGLIYPPTGQRRRGLIAKGIDPVAEAVVISYLPRPGGQMPSFFAVRYRAPCPASPEPQPATWQRIGEQ